MEIITFQECHSQANCDRSVISLSSMPPAPIDDKRQITTIFGALLSSNFYQFNSFTRELLQDVIHKWAFLEIDANLYS